MTLQLLLSSGQSHFSWFFPMWLSTSVWDLLTQIFSILSPKKLLFLPVNYVLVNDKFDILFPLLGNSWDFINECKNSSIQKSENSSILNLLQQQHKYWPRTSSVHKESLQQVLSLFQRIFFSGPWIIWFTFKKFLSTNSSNPVNFVTISSIIFLLSSSIQQDSFQHLTLFWHTKK